MTCFSGEVRLRDIPKLDRYALVNVLGAMLTFGAAGSLLGTTATTGAADVAVVVLLVLVGVMNVYIVDRELREVSP